MKHAIAIVGGGIVGLAAAWQAQRRFPGDRILLIEKERQLATHQTARNSGVLHSGIYYKPGSLKAINCRSGKEAMEAFCREEGIVFERCGKVIVASDESELPALETILERGAANGVACRRIDRRELRELEPHAAGVAAIHVPETGIIRFRDVALRLAERLREEGHDIVTARRVRAITARPDGIEIVADGETWRAAWGVNCGGLHSDRVARLAGLRPAVRIVPFRGEYYELLPEARGLCRNLIYPVPDPRFPFLGVHFTRMVGDEVECGPNAVLAFAREGYRFFQVRLGDLWSTLSYAGFWRMAARYWRTGVGEMYRSLSKRAFVRALQKLVPEVRPPMLRRGRAGVRAQAVRPDGRLVDDFLIERSRRMIHVINAPSPAATSALQIGKTIVERLEEARRDA